MRTSATLRPYESVSAQRLQRTKMLLSSGTELTNAGASSAFACRYSSEGSTSMHVHANQVNQYAQLDAMYAAQKAAGKRAAEQTRRKLLESSSALAGEADSEAAVVK